MTVDLIIQFGLFFPNKLVKRTDKICTKHYNNLHHFGWQTPIGVVAITKNVTKSRNFLSFLLKVKIEQLMSIYWQREFHSSTPHQKKLIVLFQTVELVYGT